MIDLASETERLLAFAEHSRHPEGGFAWLNADGTPDLERPRELWITTRMTHVFALGELLGWPGAAELVARMEGRAALNDQKFENVAMRFTERDRRGQLIVESNRDAIASALAAQKEDTTGKYEANRNAATKLESYFAHQTEQTQQLLQEMRRSTEDKITDIKERLDKGEGTQKGGQDTRSEQRMNTGHIMGIIGGVVGMLALLWTISQGFLVGNNERKISALLRDTNIVPPGYVLVPAPTAGK